MNAPFHSDLTTLDRLPVGAKGRVLSVDWSSLDHGEACRLKHFGFYEGATVEPLHLGPLGRDPIAVRVGRMTVAIRRKHAAAVSVSPLAK
jgi:ferrous iron transport protein A